MERIIAYCGLICNECPVFLATRENDLQKKVELANQYTSDTYQVIPADINCSGCTSSCSQAFKFCLECDIRLCGIEKEISNCAYCSEYPCSKLEKPFENAPENKLLLDEMKRSI
ncbi:MAG TPA: DUF3795 domain-containing protein [Patescibacteria group bacterium]|nr:DUF3795 domain-containing protein [Patescibacteria group bacterium]